MRLDNSDEDNFAELIYISSDDELDTEKDAIESDDEAEFDSNNAAAGLLDDLETVPPPELSYSVLTESDIRRRIDDDINQLSAVLCLPKSDTTLILRHFDWDASKVEDSWFADESEIRRQVGLPVATQQVTSLRPDHRTLTCSICFESHRLSSFSSAPCGHQFCRWCWRNYIAASVNDGPSSLKLKCPEPSCKVLAGDDLIKKIADEKVRTKYSNFALRSFVENSRRRKWCPAPNCQHAVEFTPSGDLNYDVSCLCSHSFCWNCTEDKHRPVDCETVKNWSLKNASESQNEMWKKVNTKPCPKCGRAIEKNKGCMHMTCAAPCRHHFCWVCLGPLGVSHTSCNGYNDDGSKDGLQSLRAEVKRYQHYYERWAENEKSRQIAVNDLKNVRTNVVSEIAGALGLNVSQLDFLIEAWEQIVECRRVLKWTYAYGYYLPVGEAAKKQFFEYLQGQAETCLERLHDCAEKEMRKFVLEESCMHEYVAFQKKLNELTKLSKTYFENLVRALENRLSEVEAPIEGKRRKMENCDKTSMNKKRQRKVG
ncbi:unnamed protein product [Linum tenue]|uniref:RBR-type E3 ubiquitin transferase n=2 Tax=Linum tenue TaxID=586396 RepID=A0AAV0P3G2_9ROSI|nr:unnamed protein product [Linum tenue]